MKFKLIASLVVIAAVIIAVVISGGVDEQSAPNTSNDGIQIH